MVGKLDILFSYPSCFVLRLLDVSMLGLFFIICLGAEFESLNHTGLFFTEFSPAIE
jgi:hypothetical protein